jgi:hypothetical protein
MPSTIPYDPSLVLGSVITDKALDIVKNFADIQGPVDAAQDTLNGLISAKQSLGTYSLASFIVSYFSHSGRLMFA